MKIHGTLYPCFIESLDENKSNSADSDGNTLLHMAVQCLQPDVCTSLLKAGCVVDKVNGHGNTSLLELLSIIDMNIVNQVVCKYNYEISQL